VSVTDVGCALKKNAQLVCPVLPVLFTQLVALLGAAFPDGVSDVGAIVTE